MLGVLLAIIISIVLPLGAFVYALYRKSAMPFILGVLAFVISQILLRIPLIKFLSAKSTGFNMFSVTEPVVYVILLGFSAGIFEGVARYLAMRYFLKQRDWKAGFLFGAGHGGIEAVIFLGISAITIISTQSAFAYSDAFLVGSLERFFAMLFHIGVSIIVLQSIVTKRMRYLVVAIILHGVMDSFVGLVPMFVPQQATVFVIEGLLIVISISVIIYSIRLKRKGVL